MSLNVPFSPESQGGGGNQPGSRVGGSLKFRTIRVLRAYLNAPRGCGVEAVYRCLSSLVPVPTYREAAQLTSKLPAAVGAPVLARFFAFLQAVEREEARKERLRVKGVSGAASVIPAAYGGQKVDWTPAQEGGAA